VTATVDPFVLEQAPGPVVAVDPSIEAARVAVRSAMHQLSGMSDASLGCIWNWNGNDADLRYAFYRLLELLETAASELGRALGATASTQARDAVAAASAARWHLHGILAPIDDSTLDADPGGGEWTVRQTLAHIVSSQRGYAWGSAWWLSHRDDPRAEGPQRIPLATFEAMPEEADEALGDLAAITERFDDLLDATAGRYATLTPDDLSVMGGWSGIPVTIAFRQWRWSSHIQEHTVQVEKTLQMLGVAPTEVHRLVRLIADAYGRLEALAFGRELGDGDPSEILRAVDRAVTDLLPGIEAAVRANVLAPDW
jgi:hypothetical protein